MKKFKINSKFSSTRKVSRESLITWHDVNERKKREAEATASKIMSDLLNNIDTIVYGEFSEKSSCSLIPLYSASLEMRGNKLLNKDEDRRLLNWKKWIEIREKESKKIAKATLRHRQELLLNSNPNDLRKILKEKEIIEKSRNNVGDLNFWRVPEKSKNKLCLTVPMSQKCCTPPEITFTQTPDAILKEQNISRDNKNTTEKFLEIADSHARNSVLNINSIAKYRPRMEKLAVCANVEDISQELMPKVENKVIEEPKKRKQILVINNNVLDVTNEDKCDYLLDVTFNGFKYEKHSKSIKFENHGEIAVNVHLEKMKIADQYNFLELPTDQTIFFDKNLFRIIPGQIKEIKFNFFAKIFGVFNEKWAVKCDPPFMDNHSVVINLLGSCVQKHKRNELNEFKEEILRKSAEQNVKKEIQNILNLITPKFRNYKRQLYDDTVREKFLKLNPNLNYHSDVVDILSEIYEEVKKSECEWDYNVYELYKIILNIHDSAEKQQLIYHRFNDALQQLMDKNRLSLEHDEKLIKNSLIKNNFAIFLEKFETEMEETNDIRSIKKHLINTINKMINILES